MIKIYNYEGSNRQGMSFKNLHLLPLYYFFPEDIIKAHPKDFQSIPRNPQNILKDKNVLDYVESAYSYGVLARKGYPKWRRGNAA